MRSVNIRKVVCGEYGRTAGAAVLVGGLAIGGCGYVSTREKALVTNMAVPAEAFVPDPGAAPARARYGSFDQINKNTVKDLRVAWTYYTGDMDAARPSTIECMPLVVGRVVFVTTVRTSVVALDAETGREYWRFNPYAGRRIGAWTEGPGVNRGVAFWSDRSDATRRRVVFGTSDGRLMSIDASTGQPDPQFGHGGTVNLRDGVDIGPDVLYGMTSAPGVFEDIIVIGTATGEGPGPVAPGDIRAFDVRTGKEVWRFHTVPRPGELGHETWEGESWKNRGGVNAWSGVTIDDAGGRAFVALGSPAFDFFGGDRKGNNLFGNSVVALDARTGQRIWHFQAVKHDLWDYDLPTPPILVEVQRDGRTIDAVLQLTKMGHVFVLDRTTGASLFPLEERSVPSSDVPGESASPTQIFPLNPPPIARQVIGEQDVTSLSPGAREAALERYRRSRVGNIFTPPSLRGTILLPGTNGGPNWSGASFDPVTRTAFVNSNNWPAVITLAAAPEGAKYKFGFTGYERFVDKEGYPAIAPPWGLLTAVDLDRGEFRWQSVLGEFAELTRRGIPQTGTPTFGGSIVTAGGLVFIGGTMDERFRAFDAATGTTVWEHQLAAGAYATPVTYMAGGRQFVLVAAGGGGRLRTRAGDAFVAFALPSGRPETPSF